MRGGPRCAELSDGVGGKGGGGTPRNKGGDGGWGEGRVGGAGGWGGREGSAMFYKLYNKETKSKMLGVYFCRERERKKKTN